MALVVAATALGAEPVLPSSSDWGSGSVKWQVEAGRVRGFLTGGECPTDGPVIDGSWLGDVLVGTVKLCQRGNGCEDKSFPLFAFYMHQDGSLVADVKLDKGCTSPALKDGRLVLTAHLSEPAPQASAPKEHRERRRGSTGSSSVAQASATQPLSAHLSRGQQALQRGDGKAAYDEFSLALDAQEDLAGAYLGLGESEMLLGHPRSALREYRKSLAARPDKITYYNLACAQAKLNSPSEALDSLRKAIELGYNDAAALTHDPELAPLHDDPEFQRIVALIWARQPTRRR